MTPLMKYIGIAYLLGILTALLIMGIARWGAHSKRQGPPSVKQLRRQLGQLSNAAIREMEREQRKAHG